MGLRDIGNWLLPGDPFGKDGPDQGVVDNYNAGRYDGQQTTDGYAPGTGMPGMTNPGSMGRPSSPTSAMQYQPYSGSALGSVGMNYGMSPLSSVQGSYEPSASMASSALSSGPNPFAPQQGGGFWGDMSGAEKAALITQGVGALGGIYGSWKQGKAQDEDRQRAQDEHDRVLKEREDAAKAMAPLVAKYLGKYGKTDESTGG